MILESSLYILRPATRASLHNQKLEDMFGSYVFSVEMITPETIIDYIEHDLSCETENNEETPQFHHCFINKIHAQS